MQKILKVVLAIYFLALQIEARGGGGGGGKGGGGKGGGGRGGGGGKGGYVGKNVVWRSNGYSGLTRSYSSSSNGFGMGKKR
jgi:hypothetical protein